MGSIWSNGFFPVVFSVLGMLSAYLLRDFGEAMIFFTAALAQFVSFVLVSRLRQRGSFFWHAASSLAANGTWYITLHIFDNAEAYWLLIFPYISGVVAGRTIGVALAQYVENRFKLKSDATRDPRLSPEERWKFVMREPTFWVLFVALTLYLIYGVAAFDEEFKTALFIVVGLGILQNLFYAMQTRAVQRGSNTYIATMGILSGTVFYVSAAYLFSKDLPLLLLMPYVLSTTLGSTTGAFFSMVIEWSAKLSPDKHLEKETAKKESRAPYAVIAVLAFLWLVLNETILGVLGYQISNLSFPLPIPGFELLPRFMIMLAAAVIFFLDSALHTVTSRAGNRNHTGYHISACIPKGCVDFSKLGYLALNSRIPDVVPAAVLASCFGSLFGKNVSERIEKWLEARMDVKEAKGGTNAARTAN